jgi:hypothetical protein
MANERDWRQATNEVRNWLDFARRCNLDEEDWQEMKGLLILQVGQSEIPTQPRRRIIDRMNRFKVEGEEGKS